MYHIDASYRCIIQMYHVDDLYNLDAIQIDHSKRGIIVFNWLNGNNNDAIITITNTFSESKMQQNDTILAMVLKKQLESKGLI